MKNLKLLMAILLSSIALILMQSCNTDSNPASSSSDDSFQSFAVYNYDVSDFTLQDATLDNDFILEDCQPMRPDLGDSKEGKQPKFNKRVILFRVFNEMNLSDEQKQAIRLLMTNHILCEMEWFKMLQEARKPIMEAARLERAAIMEQAKAGEITRKEASELIRQLNIRVRAAIAALEVNEEVREGLLLCKEEFFAAIAELLTEEQLVIWERFLAGQTRG